jgi:ferredoxin
LTRDSGEAVVATMAEELVLRAPRHRISFVHSTFDSTTFALKGKLKSLKADLPYASWKILFSDPGQFDRQGKEYDEKGQLDVGTYAALLPDDDFDVFVCGPSDFVASAEKSLNALEPRRFRLFKQDMGVATGPPTSAMREKELPPLEPRSIDFVRTGRQATWNPERGTLLEFAEHLGIAAPFSCRTGMCGTCAQRIIAGETAEVRKTIAKADEGRRLLCSVIPMSDIQIDL